MTAVVPDQRGRTFVVTGPSPGGIGAVLALELARAGARVVLAGRDAGRLLETEQAISRTVPGARLEQLVVDLADLASIRHAAGRAARLGPIDVLINNAGVMAPPPARSPDGFDLQWATNHFGPFLLTGLLLPQLSLGSAARVVAVSSGAHRFARTVPLGDPRDPTTAHPRWPTYAATKLANLLFTFELDRRLRASELPITALAAHPGLSGTRLFRNGPLRPSAMSIADAATRAVARPPSEGARPVLMAATAELPGSTFCGPGGPAQISGPPAVVAPSSAALDADLAGDLWQLSEEAVRLTWP